MNRLLITSALALVALTAHAGSNTQDERWFGDGLGWEEHPCGLQAFTKYGHDDTPATRHAYEVTKQHPELCSRMFP